MDGKYEQRLDVLEKRMNQHGHLAIDNTTPLSETCFVTYVLPGTLATVAGNFGIFFVAPYPCFILGIAEVHVTANGGAATLQVEKLTGTQAPGAGTTLLNTSFNLNATANTPQYAGVKGGGTLVANVGLLQGERLALKESGALVSLGTVCITLQLQY